MDRSPESQNQAPAEKRKCEREAHPSETLLLLASDGELPSREAAEVEAHLQACWSCRARRAAMEEAIADLVEYRDHLVRSCLPPAQGRRGMFIAQLEQLAPKVGQPSLCCRVTEVLRASWAYASEPFPRQLWISGLLLTAFGLALLIPSWHVTTISAEQFLENAQMSEVKALQGVSQPVIYQKLRIHVEGRSATRTIYHDSGNNRRSDRLEVDESDQGSGSARHGTRHRRGSLPRVEAEFQRAFLDTRLNWQDPLSPASFTAWHNSLNQKQDEVSRRGNDFLTLKTTTPEGPIADATLTVRTADFHPVLEDLRLQDEKRVEIEEIGWEVFSVGQINPAVFEADALRPRSPAISRSESPAVPAVPSECELAEAELQARVALHVEGADLGEPVAVERSKPGSVVVHGIVNTSERRDQLVAALQGIPHIELRLQSVEEAVQEQQPAEPAPGSRAIVVAGKPALEQRLEEQFPNSEDRAAFVNAAVELTQGAMAQAWALRRLRERYTREEVVLLSRSSQRILELLIRDHVPALRQRVEAAKSLLSPLLPAIPEAGHWTAVIPAAALCDWRDTVMGIFMSARKVQDDVTTLFTEPGDAVSDPQALAYDLQLTLSELETWLSNLHEQLRGPFLTEREESQ